MVPERWLVLTVRPSLPASCSGPDAQIAEPGTTGGGAGSRPDEAAGSSADSDAAGLFAEALIALGGRAVTEFAEGFTTHLPEPPDAEAFVAEARERLVALTGIPSLEVEWAWQSQEDWAEYWKRGLRPRRITDRVTIAPSWDTPPPREGEIVITIDPGLAFGTAEHGTTRGSIRLLDRTLAPGERVLDVGSGSGILAIAAARLGAREVVAVEGDPYATAAAAENLALNGIEVVEIVETWASVGSLTSRGSFDGIIANIESGVLIPLLSGFAAALAPGGWLIVSGILQTESDDFLRVALPHGFRLEEEDREDEWWSARFRGLRPDDRALPEDPAAP
ncbi:MAG: 50S ribosomal protein L11 methyltransferase [Gemmatimonadota bacterium]